MNKNNIKINFIYNIIYQILLLILPLITSPYISRVIGAEGLGIYSYTYSIAYYFVLFAMLGINNYGNREIAKSRENKEQLSRKFCAIYTIQLITSIISIIAYIIYILCIENEYKLYAILQLIYILSNCFDVNWLFFGLEKFKITVTRNIIIKILSVCSIFVFVKDRNDLVLYTLIITLSALISQLALWPFVKKEVKFLKIRFSDLKKHIKPILILFIPVIAVSLYKVMDKIMLGNMTNVKNVGLYENAEKIINIPLGLITALGTVMLPRMSNLVSNGNQEQIKRYIDKSIEFIAFISVPISLGIMAVSKEFAPLFFGQEFTKSGEIIQYLAITVIFISWANVIRTQYLIPNEKDKAFIVSVVSGAIINIIINLLLIKRYETIGAAIGTLIAEFTVMIIQLFAVRKELNNKLHAKKFLIYFIKGIIMYTIVNLLKWLNMNYWIKIFDQIIVGIIVYFSLNYKYILGLVNSDFQKRKLK